RPDHRGPRAPCFLYVPCPTSCHGRSPGRVQYACDRDASPASRPGCEARCSATPPSGRPFSLLALLGLLLRAFNRGHYHHVADLVDLTTQRRRHLLDDDSLVVPQSHGAERQPVLLRMTDAAADLLDANLAGLGQLERRRLLRSARRMP